ncbi:DeoR/GlpR family DNA-binding transcription regulator [Pectinatus sottacetonis]|uniref:DeoR/GlpR family DNA-binding transcription regulator n=1 Tax=Pectinatus sottacetonis TaxID=1002795 RepID=UPI0018C6DD14|nr:DeoR/GlpR family DNA-binding transcription regulator [Pectinatus sottacetonis]
MFVQERQEKIIELLQERGRVLVKDLSIYFKVTDDCIRKDLALLEKKGLLKRVYGGAVLYRTNTHQLKVQQRRDVNIEQKQIIAQKALSLINEGEVIFLDISTINIELAKLIFMAGLKVTVITNMIAVMSIAVEKKAKDFIFIGGVLDSGSDGFIGTTANDIIKKFQFDAAFMGAVGIDIYKNAVYTYKAEDGYTKKTAVEAAGRRYILAESEKFSRSGNFIYAAVTDFNAIVTEKKLPSLALKKLQEYAIMVF